jgi:hypothetical protein
VEIKRGECRSLTAWLVSQERVMRLWIDEMAATSVLDVEFIRKLEDHHQWLSDRIEELAERAA